MAHNAKSPTPEAVRALIQPIIEEAELFSEDVTISGPHNRAVLRITLDLPEDEIGSLDLDRVSQVTRPISDALDASDLFKGAYNLEVTTPGTSRPLTERRHFMRARTRLIRFTLSTGSTLRGRLTAVEGSELVLDVDGDERRVALEEVTHGDVEIELRRMADADLEATGDDVDEEA